MLWSAKLVEDRLNGCGSDRIAFQMGLHLQQTKNNVEWMDVEV